MIFAFTTGYAMILFAVIVATARWEEHHAGWKAKAQAFEKPRQAGMVR